MFSYFLLIQPVLAMLGTPVLAKMDESLEKLRMAFEHPPPLFRKKNILQIFREVHDQSFWFYLQRICNDIV